MKNILWTGGWDSTFRVCDLVLIKNEKVQPYYVLDKNRQSTPVEIKTMEKIKKKIFEKKPEARNLIKDTIMIKIDSIPKEETVTSDWTKLRSISHLGEQYDWLARYVKANHLENIELGIHKDDKAEEFIRNDVIPIEEGKDFYYKMRENLSIPELRIFSSYHFPLLNLTKLEMAEAAKKNNFQDILESTWFCFNPTKDGQPCGFCNPCRYTREEGLGRRVPEPSLYRKFRHKAGIIKYKVFR